MRLGAEIGAEVVRLGDNMLRVTICIIITGEVAQAHELAVDGTLTKSFVVVSAYFNTQS